MHIKRYIVLILSTIMSVFNIPGIAREGMDREQMQDTTVNLLNDKPDSLIIGRDSLLRIQGINNSDTTKVDTSQKKSEDITAEVNYTAEDSIIISMEEGQRKVFLYGNAIVRYSSIELTADFVEFNMTTNEVFAHGLPNDTTGKIEGLPVFKDEGETFNAQTLKYNFKTRKGYIEAVRTQQDEGYLHSEKTRKDQFGHIHMQHGKYTTCDKEHPDFYLALTKAKSMPGDKIVSGPAYLVIADIPLPIGLPFGFFPSTKRATSGLLLPEYGEENGRGFYLRNGGYYWAINQFIDMRFTGDIYTNGTWGIRTASAYRWRYKFSGSFNVRFYQNIEGEKLTRGLPNSDYSKSKDYSIALSHNQDPKSNPNLHYGASVNISTRRFDQNHSRVLSNALTNQKQSSVSLQKTWPGTPFNLSASANHSQNSRTGDVDLNLPKVSFNMNRIYPFRTKTSSNDKWYHQIQLSYSSNLDNRIRTVDTLLFTNKVWNNMRSGFEHRIPFSYNFKPKRLRNFNISPSLSYAGAAYTSYINKRREIVNTTVYRETSKGSGFYHPVDTSYYQTVVDTFSRFSYAHAIMPSISFGLNPKIYGTYTFKPSSKIQSIRHVMSPTASLSLVPDVSKIIPSSYRDLRDENGKVIETYSIYANGIYPAPSLNRRSRTMSLALRNTLEAKMRQDSDTASKVNKVRIFDNFDFNSSVNFDDSIKFSPIGINANTTIFKGKLHISMRGGFDPYALVYDAPSRGLRRINRSEYSYSGKLGRLTNAGISTGFTFQSKQGNKDQGEANAATQPTIVAGETANGPINPTEPQYAVIDEGYPMGRYVDFDVPWSVRADYSLSYSNNGYRKDIIQTLRFSGDLSLTQKWKINFSSGFDLKAGKFTTSDFSIYRDLHCWEMRFTAVPSGMYKSFNFQINVKASVLQDLKYEKRIPWQDNY